MPAEYNISPIFNIGDFTLHKPDQEFGTILLQEGGVDAKASSNKILTKVMQEQNSASGLASTPIAHEKQRTSNDTSHRSRRDLRILKEAKGSQHTIETSILSIRELADNNNRAIGEPDDQQTLLTLLCADRRHLDREEDGYVISLHGPSYKGPRVLLTIQQEAHKT